jgi:hypothetical protein
LVAGVSDGPARAGPVFRTFSHVAEPSRTIEQFSGQSSVKNALLEERDPGQAAMFQVRLKSLAIAR